MDKMRGGGGQIMSVLVHAQGTKTVHAGGGALCFEWGFMRTFPGNQDVAVK